MSKQWTDWKNATNIQSSDWQNGSNILLEDGLFASVTGDTFSNFLDVFGNNSYNIRLGAISVLPATNSFQNFTRVATSETSASVNSITVSLDAEFQTLNINGFDFSEINSTANIFRFEVRIKHFNDEGIWKVDTVQMRIEYEPGILPFSNPSAKEIGAFEAKIDSTIGTYASPSISERGVVLSTSPNPTTSDTKIIVSGTTTGSYTANLTGLAQSTQYYVRSYVIDSGDTFYSPETTFTTRTIAITHVDATEVKAIEATLTATVDPELRLNVTERGFIWSISANPTFDNNVVVVGDGDGEFSTTVSDLTPEREIFYRVYIKYENSPEVTFTTGVLSFVTLPQVLVPKTFFYRFFDSQLVYQHSFRKEGFEVETIPEFIWKINGGMGLMGIDILAPVEDFVEWTQELANTVAVMQCVVHDSETSDKGRVLYTGVAGDSRYNLTGEGFIKLDGFKYAHAGEFDLNKKQLQDISGNTRISYSNMDFADIYRDLIDKYQLQGALCDYTDSSIQDVGLTLSITFQNESFLDAMKRLAGFLPERWYFYIDGNNILHLNQTNLNEPDHIVTIGKEVSSGDFILSFADIVNDVYFNGGDTGSGFLYRKRTLQSSITQYGIRAERISDERVTVPETADLRMEQILRTKGQPIRYIEFTVEDGNLNRSGYDIESLKVGDSIQVLHPSLPTDITRYQNSAGTVGNAVYNQSFYNYDVNASLGVPFQIQEIKYEGNKAIIRSSDVITNQAQTIRQLQKQQLVQSTINSPDAPSS